MLTAFLPNWVSLHLLPPNPRVTTFPMVSNLELIYTSCKQLGALLGWYATFSMIPQCSPREGRAQYLKPREDSVLRCPECMQWVLTTLLSGTRWVNTLYSRQVFPRTGPRTREVPTHSKQSLTCRQKVKRLSGGSGCSQGNIQ